MSKIPKALSTSLKAAKASLAASDYAGALRTCEAALETAAGEAHFRLHVFAGAAAQGAGETDAAERFLRRATEIAPEEAAAWQGLEDLYAQRYQKAGTAEARRGAEDHWVESLRRLAAVGSKRRKVDVKLARVLQSSGDADRRVEAWQIWNELLATATKEAQTCVPLEAAVEMVMASSLPNGNSTKGVPADAVPLGDSSSRCAVLAKYLDFSANSGSGSALDVPRLAVVERYVCEKLQGLSAGMDEADHSELVSLRTFVASHAKCTEEMSALLHKDDLVHGCSIDPIIFEACLLPLLLSRSCDLCSQLDHLERSSAEESDSTASNYAKFLLNEHPDRPVAHLRYTCCDSSSSLISDLGSALEHARLGMKFCHGDRKSNSESRFFKAAGPVVAALVTSLCSLRLSDLLLISSHGSILSGEGTTATGSTRSKVLHEIVSHAGAGLARLAACTKFKHGPDTNGAASSPPLYLVGLVRQALRVCKATAIIRLAAPGSSGRTLAISVLASMPAVVVRDSDSDLETDREIIHKLSSAAYLCALEADVRSGNFEEARKRGEDWASKDQSGLILAASTALLALANFCEGGTPESARISVAGFEKALGIFQTVESSCRSSPAALHLSACIRYWLAQAMWNSEIEEYRSNRKHCFENLIAAAKLKPEWGAPFGLLGQYYMTLPGKPNSTRAEKCLERALAANPCLEKEGMLLANSILSGVYESQKKNMEANMPLSQSFVFMSNEKEGTKSAIERAQKLYKNAIEQSGGHAIWAWRGLGVMHMSVSVYGVDNRKESKPESSESINVDVDGAIECFQSLLRLRPKDVDAWERLGHAYALARRYTAAIKSFETALDLSPGRPSSLRELAEVKLSMGMTKDCTLHLREALVKLNSEDVREKLPDHCVTNEISLCERSLAVSLLAQARIQLSSDMFLHARESAAEGLTLARRVRTRMKGMLSPVKLVGDLHSLLGALPATVMLSKYGRETNGLSEQENEEEEKRRSSEGDEIWREGFAAKRGHLKAAVECYQSLVEMHRKQSVSNQNGNCGAGKRKNRASAWMDLGVALFRLNQAVRVNRGWDGRDMYKDQSDKSRGDNECTGSYEEIIRETRLALKNAILFSSANGDDQPTADESISADLAVTAADAWNVLGVVETEMAFPPRPLVAQYAFIRALHLSNGNHAQAWSNLGFLYLKCGFSRRALAAFMTSQSLAPASSIMWCGLGIISAERGNQSKRALKSYKCAIEYFPHFQAKLGLGLSAINVGDYASAVGALQRAVDENPCDADARNALALAEMQLGNSGDAKKEFKRAEMLLEYQRSEHEKLNENGGVMRLDAAIDQLKANQIDTVGSDGMVVHLPARVELSQDIFIDRAFSLVDLGHVCDTEATHMRNSFDAVPEQDVQRAEQSINLLLKLTEIRWWNRISLFSSASSLRDVTDVISGLWMQLARSLMTRGNNMETHDLCLSCVRFAICVAGHGGSIRLITEGLVYLGSTLLAKTSVSVDGSAAKRSESEENTKPTFALRSNVFHTLTRRPRWIDLPLATRKSCHGAPTARSALTCAIHLDPSCRAAWDLLRELPSP